MNKYNWKGYDFIGTVPEFAEKFGYCKTPTFVNAVKRDSTAQIQLHGRSGAKSL